jgi:hypothetical protein
MGLSLGRWHVSNHHIDHNSFRPHAVYRRGCDVKKKYFKYFKCWNFLTDDDPIQWDWSLTDNWQDDVCHNLDLTICRIESLIHETNKNPDKYKFSDIRMKVFEAMLNVLKISEYETR